MSLTKASLSAVPIFGGPLATLIGEYVPMDSDIAIQDSLDMLKKKFIEYEQRVAVEKVDRDEFADMFKSFFYAIVRTHDKRKRDVATSAVVNILLKEGDPEKLTFCELDHFVRCVDMLSSGAVEVLAVVRRDYRIDQENLVFGFDGLHTRLAKHGRDLLKGLLCELEAFNLIRMQAGVGGGSYSDQKFLLTEMGAKFVDAMLMEDE